MSEEDRFMKNMKKKPPKIPDRRAIEGTMFDLVQSMRDKEFGSIEEMNAHLQTLTAQGGVKKGPPKNAVHVAQQVMYEAWDADSPKKRIQLAKRALAISPDCADAYNCLAEQRGLPVKEQAEIYRKGVEAGERALGQKAFTEDVGHFWGILETRPYMRARKGLADCLWILGEKVEALNHYREMLRLNPGDNQGIRYVLLAALADLDDFGAMRSLLESQEYKDDCVAEWLYAQALVKYREEGDSLSASQALKEAFDQNKHVPDMLLGRKPIPREFPETITMGGEDEAMSAAAMYLRVWKRIPGALQWLASKWDAAKLPKVGRNDPCPCGSGRKFKKCCLN